MGMYRVPACIVVYISFLLVNNSIVPEFLFFVKDSGAPVIFWYFTITNLEILASNVEFVFFFLQKIYYFKANR